MPEDIFNAPFDYSTKLVWGVIKGVQGRHGWCILHRKNIGERIRNKQGKPMHRSMVSRAIKSLCSDDPRGAWIEVK